IVCLHLRFLCFFCENHEERGRRGRKKELRKKNAFAFFHIEIIPSLSSLFSFVPKKAVVLPMIFMSGLRLKSHGGFL
ncbi:hypothetical protein, partial [Aneurinibacillus sp. UBA3580]|uniref:hypothetical protein n=1 Tax=Aneurinibacillus sp. UBA3580 TaxID=1946041 RepID=UPI00257A86D3